METLRERIERHLTLPELLDILNVDYEEMWADDLSTLFRDRESDIEELLEEYE